MFATMRDEVKASIEALDLPVDTRGERRAAARVEWVVRNAARAPRQRSPTRL